MPRRTFSVDISRDDDIGQRLRRFVVAQNDDVPMLDTDRESRSSWNKNTNDNNDNDADRNNENIVPTPSSTIATETTNIGLVDAEPPLENDDCALTRERETEFFIKLGLEELERYSSSVYTVIHSRSLTKHYGLPANVSIPGELLTRLFSKIGHTLTIDNTRSYVRLLDIDVDCLCRRAKTSATIDVDHINEAHIGKMLRELFALLQQKIPHLQLGEAARKSGINLAHRPLPTTTAAAMSAPVSTIKRKRLEFKFNLWKRACGYHVYTNVPVSLPLHHILVRYMNLQCANMPLRCEVPSKMPLMYSAKKPNEPYLPCFNDQPSIDYVVPPTYYELFDYMQRERDQCARKNENVIGTIYRNNGSMVCIERGVTVEERTGIPYLHDMVRYELNNDEDDGTNRLRSFLQHAIDHRDTSNEHRLTSSSTVVSYDDLPGVDVRNRDALNALGKAVFAERSPNLRTDDENLYAKSVSITIGSRPFHSFMKRFNKINFNRENDPSYGAFVKIAMCENGGLYLQPYVVALDKALDIAQPNVFRECVLYPLLVPPVSSNVERGDATVEQFIQLYDKNTREAYFEWSWKDILRYQSFVFVNGLRADMRLDEIINTVLVRDLNVSSNLEYLAKVREKSTKQAAIEDFVPIYMNLAKTLKLYMYDEAAKMWHVLSKHGNYQSCAKIENMPGMNEWIGKSDARCLEELKGNEINLWTSTEYMIPTYVGVFNTITGLYTAHSPLLRFDKIRHFVLWNPERRTLRPYLEQNNEITRLGETTSGFVTKLETRFSELFIHYLLVPAVIQLRDTPDIDEYRLPRFFDLFTNHSDLRKAHFLIECYPLDERFVAFIMFLQTLLSKDIGDMFSYKRLAIRMFGTDETHERQWSDAFERFTRDLTFVDDTNDSSSDNEAECDEREGRYMHKLMRVRHPDLNVSRQGCFLSVMISLCMIKCLAYRTLTDALNASKLPTLDNLDEDTLLYVAKRLRISDKLENHEKRTDESTISERRDNNEDEDANSDNSDGDMEEFNECIRCYNNDVLKEDWDDVSFSNMENRNACLTKARRLLTDVTTSKRTFKQAFDRAIANLFGEELTQFEYDLAEIVIYVARSVRFVYANFCEFLAIVSSLFVTVNKNKKVFVLQGPSNTGKSWFCDLLMYITNPRCSRFNDMEDPVMRSAITTKCNLVLINEMEYMNVSQFKSISGNDAESGQMFYKQEYEMKTQQALLIGATNNAITFTTKKNARYRNVDRVTIDRIHSIKLSGVLCYESDDCSDSLFMMLTEHRYYHTKEVQKETMAKMLAWLAYYFYKKNRDDTYRPVIDINNSDACDYCDKVYRSNNELYLFLKKCGISEAKDLYMNKKTFIELIRGSIDTKGGCIKNYPQFKMMFEQQYNTKLDDDEQELHHFQQTMFLSSIAYSMHTVPINGHSITEEMLNDRLRTYRSEIDKSNARMYFKQHNRKFYNPTTHSYDGILFSKTLTDSYAGNVIEFDENVTTDRLYDIMNQHSRLSMHDDLSSSSSSRKNNDTSRNYMGPSSSSAKRRRIDVNDIDDIDDNASDNGQFKAKLREAFDRHPGIASKSFVLNNVGKK